MPYRILIYDAEATDAYQQSYARALVAHPDYEVTQTCHPQQLLSLVKKNSYHLIILHDETQTLDRHWLNQVIRQTKQHPHVLTLSQAPCADIRRQQIIHPDQLHPKGLAPYLPKVTQRKPPPKHYAHPPTPPQTLAYHDYLTQLPNRAYFDIFSQYTLNHAKRYQRHFSLLAIDIDNFKLVNDTFGHPAGDQLLQALSQQLKEALRSSDLLARAGGDEFWLIAQDTHNPHESNHIASKCLNAAEKLFKDKYASLPLSLSIGIADYPNDGKTIETLIQHADQALYRVKASGKKNYTHYQADTEQRPEPAPLQFCHSILEQEHYDVRFQPIYSIHSNELFALEALLEVTGPEADQVNAMMLFNCAKRLHQTDKLTHHIAEKACHYFNRWTPMLTTLRLPPKLALKLSGEQLHLKELTHILLSSCERHEISARQIILEVSEMDLISLAPTVLENFHQLANQGFAIFIDHFGRQHAAISLLTQLPISGIKLDPAITQPLNSSVPTLLFDSIQMIAEQLKLTVISTGIETNQQLKKLHHSGAQLAQGYLLNPPLNAKRLEERLTQNMGLAPQHNSLQ